MKRKYMQLLALVLVLAMALVGCGSTASAPATEAAKPDAPATEATTNEAPANKPEYVIKFGFNGSFDDEQYPAYQGMMRFEQVVEEKTNGRVDVELYLRGELGDGRTCTEAVQLGAVQMTDIENAVMVNFCQTAALYDLPFLFTSLDHAHAVLDGEIGQNIAAAYEEAGFKHLGYNDGGFRYWTNDVRPITCPADLQGLKMRVMESEVMVATMNGFGASGVPMAFTELYTALQQGTVDGQDNPLDTTIGSHFDEVQEYLILSEHFYYPRQYVINLDYYNSLPADIQTIISEAATEACNYQRECSVKYMATLVDDLEAKGMTVCELTPEGKAEFIQISQEKIWPQFYEKIGGGDAEAGKAIVDAVAAMAD